MPSWQEYRTQIRNVSSRYVERHVARLLQRVGISPHQLTVLGILLSGATAYLLSVGQFVPGGALLVLASALDLADGSLARLQGRATAIGALLDSTADRISEATIFLGLVWFYLSPRSISEVLLIFLALISSFMVSYLRARGEGLGVDCNVGVMTRPERVLVLATGLLIGQVFVVLVVIVAFSFLTALHRFWHVHNELSKR
ncbi:MAG: CDP-alcohol phosphatidyltransferase family protein [Dehalococcoidia bacterium]|nr:CDP-alcohol phosphatidyltransferase family protein [Dehalococcoidia bacterium]